MRLPLFLFFMLAAIGSCHAVPRHVIVIAMENKDASEIHPGTRSYIYGNTKDAPYLNGEFARQSSQAADFIDERLKERSQPHYILMEAGRTAFEDTRFTCDNDPGESCDILSGRPNWTKSRDHLTAQIEAARKPALTWMTYQEGLQKEKTGACPVNSAGLYAAKHNPFVYFSDIAGEPPSANNAHCIAHTRALSQFADDMAADALANYVFITPDLCNDMHGAHGCSRNSIKAGDDFLRSFLPPLLSWAQHNKAVVFVVWDEGKIGKTLPFYAAGWGVKTSHVSKI